MLLRSMIAGALVLVLALASMPSASAGPRTPAYARIECVGLYCRRAPVPGPRDPLTERKTRASATQEGAHP